MIVGIDPGLTGAISWWRDGVPQDVVDMPTLVRIMGKGNQVDARRLAHVLMTSADSAPLTCAYLEYVNAAPMQGRRPGAQSMFNFGEGYGIILGVLGSLGIPYTIVMPRAWKAHHRLLNKDKDASRTLCIQSHPHFASRLHRKMDGGRADALLIGGYGAWLEFNS